MTHAAEFTFFQNILKNMHLEPIILEEPFHYDTTDFDLGLPRLIYPDIDYPQQLQHFCRSCAPNMIYKIFDEYLFNYLIFLLPGTDKKTCILIGPYTLTHWNQTTLLELAETFHIPPAAFTQFREFYERIPYVANGEMLVSIVNTFCTTIGGSVENYALQRVSPQNPLQDFAASFSTYESAPQEQFAAMQAIERRYHAENDLMQSIIQGNSRKIEAFVDSFTMSHLESRTADPIRNAKNYAIIMNTLLRKAAEVGSVHPLYVDKLSAQFAHKIELLPSVKDATALLKEMARKYVLLVRNHSLKGYSPIVRRVLIYIDSNLSSDLSLKTHAKHLNVNPSYLSSVFKKETGSTLTDYVARKRVDHAIFLLNTTTLQIQTIAQHCGIPDICYFTKTFKKLTGKTPSEYRNLITSK
ncbi:MAG: AraC family transcriptional regulator [Firmicutes bacterium]|nr:AraC family transcriptional regulator [Bacillota bacterium]